MVDVNSNVTSFLILMREVNILTTIDGISYLGIGILMMVGFVAFLTTKNYSTERSLGFSTFLSLVTAIFLRVLGFINDWILTVVSICFALALILLWRERGVEEFGV